MAKQGVREQLLQGLQGMTKMEDPSAESLTSWTNSFGALLGNAYELNDNALAVSMGVAATITSNALSSHAPYECSMGVMNAIDQVLVAKNIKEHSRTSLSSVNHVGSRR